MIGRRAEGREGSGKSFHASARGRGVGSGGHKGKSRWELARDASEVRAVCSAIQAMLSKHRSWDLHGSAQAPYNGGLCGKLISRATTTTGTKKTKETMDPAPGSMPFHANFTVSPRLDRGWPKRELISRAAITLRTKKSEEIMDPSLGNMLSLADLNVFPRLDQVGPVQELVPRRSHCASEA